MKKTIIALLALGGWTHAAYVWNGGAGNFTATDWANKDNWALTDGSTWQDNTNGPNTGSSSMWAAITIDTAAHFTGLTLEGWTPNFTLSNGASIANSTSRCFSGTGSVNLGAGCSFDLSLTGGGNYNSGTNTYTVVDPDSLTLMIKHNGYGEANSVFNLGEKGSVNLSGNNNTIGGTSTFNATLIASEQGGLTSRVLANVSNLTLNNLTYNFEGWTLSTEEITEANYMNHIGEYWVSNADNKLTVYYATASVPEPTTATLSLLALAGLAARRRRK